VKHPLFATVLLLSMTISGVEVSAQGLITGTTTRGAKVVFSPVGQADLKDVTYGQNLNLGFVSLDGKNNKITVDVVGMSGELNLADGSGDLAADLKAAKVGIRNTRSGGTAVYIEGKTGLVNIRVELGSARGMSAITGSTAFVDNPSAIPPTPWALSIESRLLKKKIEFGGVVGTKTAYADFSSFPTGNPETKRMTLKACNGCDKNPHYKQSLRLLGAESVLSLEATLSKSKYVVLELTHLSSASGSCPNGGYSPVTIRINGVNLVQRFSPKEHSYTVDTFDITNLVKNGRNTITFTADRDMCTHYWLKNLAVYR